MKTYQIHLIRHGLTAANLTGKYIGRTDESVTVTGMQQMEEARKLGGYPTADVYYTSPRLRCIQTMYALYPGQDCYEVPGFDEMNFGDWEGKTADDLQGDETFSAWLQDSMRNAPPNGESTAEFYARICRTFEMIVEGMIRSGVQSAIIVTHSGIIMHLLARYGLPQASFYDWMTEPGRGYSLRIMPSLWMNGQKVEVYDTIPPIGVEVEGAERRMIDLGREAANRSYGETRPDEDEVNRDDWVPFAHDDDEE